MDTFEARARMLDLAQRAAQIIREFQTQNYSPIAAQQSLRGLIEEARPLIGDAGYPGEGVWSSLRRLELGFSAYGEPAEAQYWIDTLEELLAAAHTLDALLAVRPTQDLDFRIVG